MPTLTPTPRCVASLRNLTTLQVGSATAQLTPALSSGQKVIQSALGEITKQVLRVHSL